MASHLPALILNGVTIHDDGEMLSLTDLWRAADAPPDRRPDDWKKDASNRSFLDHVALIANAPVEGIWKGRRGVGGGTWAHWQIAIAYARYLDHDFHIKCNALIRERMQRPPAVPAIPNFGDPAAAARAWAEQYEARVAAERTKAEIGSRREATAMATAARANQRANVLEIKLDLSSQYATVKRVQAATGKEFSWRPLRQMSLEMNLPAEEVPDANYGTVKAYHSAVWRQVYGIELSNLSDAAVKRN